MGIHSGTRRAARKYFPQDFEIAAWEDLERELEKLSDLEISSADGLVEFWKKVSELDKIVEDTAAWLYIDMTRFSDKPEFREAFERFMETVEAKRQPYAFALQKKFYDNPFRAGLPSEFGLLDRIISKEIGLFREENVPLFVAEQKIAARYGESVAKMTVSFRGEERTVQQLAPFLEDRDRGVREEAWRTMYGRYAEDQAVLDNLFDELKDLRVRIARNAGFENYRDYKHQAKGRFSYAPEDLSRFHSAIEKIVVPFMEEMNRERQGKLGLDVLRPWDFNVDIDGENPKPFTTHLELVEKGIRTVSRIDPMFGAELEAMRADGFIDAENRKGKAPGGYCYPLYEAGSSFIFMHAVGVRRDVETFVHEAGHAMHNMMSKAQPIFQYTDNPSETAELASMAMELLSLDHWNGFYTADVLENIRKKELLEKVRFLPWGAVVDAFQHWIYLNPAHTPAERGEYFSGLLDRFKIGGDWSGLEKEKAMRWMLQLHFFQHPFYYIEYAMAQLGAIAIYRNYRQDPAMAVERYKDFLRLGYARPVPELYAAAGIRFDFSAEYVSELVDFLRSELRA